MIASMHAEFLRYKRLAEDAIAQVSDETLVSAPADGSNSIAIICRHVAGNLRSRFTDFLTADGEKPWRLRDEEFVPRTTTRADVIRDWDAGWNVLMTALDGLVEADLAKVVTIREQPLTVANALVRALAHVSYHVGQIVFAAKASRGTQWTSLSIPIGGSAAFSASSDRPRSGGSG